jgi:hypothetical protein
MTSVADSGQATWAAALLDPAAPCPPGLTVWNGSDPGARLAVHRNNVVASLVDALADTFPVVQALVGIEFFRAMAAVFVRQCPPHARVLAHYGGTLPAFIEAFEPARPVAALADVARLEWARLQAAHAADAEALDDADVSAALACGDGVAGLRLGCHPSVSVLASAHPVVSLWAAHQFDDEARRDAALAAVDTALAEAALVVRAGWDVLVLRLPPGAAAFVVALQQGVGLADAAGQALRDAAEFDLLGALVLVRQHGVLSTLHLPEETAR